tara:strand:- start:46408 stop:47721 length:1314 start_codon:yes stop_codon:yes gene_type:complete
MKKRISIIGGGVSGLGAALLAKSKNNYVFLSEKNQLNNKTKQILKSNGINYEEGHNSKTLLSSDLIIKSPGISNNSLIVKQIKDKGVPIISEIEYGFENTDSKIIAVTGTNGKTTTCLMLKHIFNQTALNVLLAGNVGNSLCHELSLKNNYDIIVLEVSSFQLENINKFQPDISVILNISDDHLDRYSNFNEYRMSKFKITKNQKKEDYLIYNYDDKSLKDLKTKANKIPFSLEREFENGVFFKKNKININLKNKKMTIDQLSLNGKHNIYNSMAAAISARVFEISDSLIRKSLQDFQNVEHRLESVLKVNNIEFINDSKATNIHASWYALESMNRTIVWIAGGVDKGNNYDELFDLVKNKVKAIIVLGDDKKINKSFKSAVENIFNVGSMKEAVNLSYDLSSDGDCVLLSPACASFNLFKSFEDRGSKFKEAVRQL